MNCSRLFTRRLVCAFGKEGVLRGLSKNAQCGSELRWQSDTLEIVSQGKTLKFNALWLRFNCHSPKSKQANSGQRLINAEKVPLSLSIKNCVIDNGNVFIDWHENAGDIEQSVIPLEYLVKNHPERTSECAFASSASVAEFDFREFFKGEEKNKPAIQSWMSHVLVYGVALLTNVPTRLGMVGEVAKLIAPLQTTIYGDIFDVISTPNPINIAYSSDELNWHMDLMYYESPPGIQYLHCITNDDVVVGGESIFLDVFLAADQFRRQNPRLFKHLTKIPATFQKIHFDRERPVYIVYQRPHIVLNHQDKIIGVNWSPPFEGPLMHLTNEEVKNYYESYIEFSKFLNNHSHRIEFKLKPGDVACFNNRRVLHGRKSFNLNGGVRHLQGCYTNIDEFKSEAIVGELLKAKQKGKMFFDKSIPVGNHDYKDGF